MICNQGYLSGLRLWDLARLHVFHKHLLARFRTSMTKQLSFHQNQQHCHGLRFGCNSNKKLYGWHGKPQVYKSTCGFCSLAAASSSSSCGGWVWPWPNPSLTATPWSLSTRQRHLNWHHWILRPKWNETLNAKKHSKTFQQCRSVSLAKLFTNWKPNWSANLAVATASVPTPEQSLPMLSSLWLSGILGNCRAQFQEYSDSWSMLEVFKSW